MSRLSRLNTPGPTGRTPPATALRKPIASRSFSFVCAGGFDDGCVLDVIQTWKMAFQIRISIFKKRLLFAGANAAPGSLPIFGIQRVRHIHAGDDFSERHEWFGIMRLGVIAQINEYLRGAAIGHGEGVREGAANIRF